MALSSYDQCAWDKYGCARRADMRFPGNILLEIYKDWLYIYDKSIHGTWISFDGEELDISNDQRKDQNISDIKHGKVRYKGIQIIVDRNKYATFIHAMYDHDYDEYHNYHQYIPQIFCGIGKYGFIGNEWVGITDEDIKEFADWLVKINSPLKELSEAKPYNQGDAFFIGTDSAMSRYGESLTIFEHLMGRLM